jgi:hypothetical protein
MLKPKYFKCPYCGKKVFYSIIDGVKKICVKIHYPKYEGEFLSGRGSIPAHDKIYAHDCRDMRRMI